MGHGAEAAITPALVANTATAKNAGPVPAAHSQAAVGIPACSGTRKIDSTCNIVNTDLTSPMPSQSAWTHAANELADLFGAAGHRLRDAEMFAVHRLPAVLPVVQYLEVALGNFNARTQQACNAVSKLTSALHWSHNSNYTDQDFLHGYAYCELMGPYGHLQHRELALGLLLLQPAITYPEHAHPALETYVVLSGHAQWRQGEHRWRDRGPSDVITHTSMEPHAMRTNAEPLLAAYLWHDRLDESARLVKAAPPELVGTAKRASKIG